MPLSRARRAVIAAVVSLCAIGVTTPAAIAAPGDLPDLVQGTPTAIAGGYFDDHSTAGDNHLAWSAGSQEEPLAITFHATLRNAGTGALEVCGYPSGTAGWMRAYQVAPGDLGGACPGSPSGGQVGWFRYVTANHSSSADYDRWHLMDLQRFALVPLPASAGGPGFSVPTVWDTRWGTCLGLDLFMDCELSAGAANLDVGIASGWTKDTQEGAPDQQLIAIPSTVRTQLPNGRYQIVAIANPYGALQESGGAGSVSCVTVQLTGAQAYSPFTVTTVDADPPSCYVPVTRPQALTGPGGSDPLAGAARTDPACPVLPSGHCWEFPAPTTSTPADPHPVATTNATGTPTPTDAVAVVRRASSTAPPATSAASTPRPSTSGPAASGTSASVRAISARAARGYVRSALRRSFGRGLRRLRVSCRVSTSSRATCAVRWAKVDASYRGRVSIRYATIRSRLRWRYSIDVTKRESGRTRHIRRAYRTGGTV